MPTIHDSGYKKLFSNKVIFRQLIETFVKEDWVKDLDFDSCDTVDKSFISEHYKEAESDIIYKIKLRKKERKEIFKKGKLEGKIEDAKNMLAEGLSISFISKVTGLSEAEILKLQSEV